MKDYQHFRSKKDIKEWVTIYYSSYFHPLVENIDRVVGSNIDWYKNDVQALFYMPKIIRWILGNNWSADEVWQEDKVYRRFIKFILERFWGYASV